MGTTRFRPTVYPLEGRDVPASGVTPQQVVTAAAFVEQTPGVLGYLEDNLGTAKAGGAGQSLLTAADLNHGAAATLTGYLQDALAANLQNVAGAAGVLIVQANSNAAAAEALANRLGVFRPVPPPPPPTGSPGNGVIDPSPDVNPPGGTPVSPTTPLPPLSPAPPSDGTSISRTVPDVSTGLTDVGTQGLQIRDERTGDGAAATATSTTTVRYRGFLQSNGTQFDTNVDNSTASSNVPFTAIIDPARRNVIQGFAEGLVGMKVGGIRTIRIPAALGYGPNGQGSIPPNADLVFQIQLLTVS